MHQDNNLQRWDRDFRGVIGRRVRVKDGWWVRWRRLEGNGVEVGGRVIEWRRE